MAKLPVIDEGTLSFSVETRILRELGERLVKQPEVAVIELVKNAYDADATECTITHEPPQFIMVQDDGVGMTLERFTNGWMRIGTSSKEEVSLSETYSRLITGEKGIGRFAVRFLGQALHLESIALDAARQVRTRLIAQFDWPQFDQHEDLGKIQVPYRLEAVEGNVSTGTTLVITRLRSEVGSLELRKVRTGSIGVLSPLRSLFSASFGGSQTPLNVSAEEDPGFLLKIQSPFDQHDKDLDVAGAILECYVLRARVQLLGDKLDLRVYRRGSTRPILEIVDTYPNDILKLYGDIRFFPRRAGSFTDLPVDGRRAYSWITENSGVAVFDRSFRVQPYGTPSDDWLQLQADAARNRRDPRSAVASKHFPMSDNVRAATSENWMLRLPQSAQLVGLVQVEGRRGDDPEIQDIGLIASADREGFVENAAFTQLQDVVRGAVEAIAYVDRMLQQEDQESKRQLLVASIRQEAQAAIHEVEANPNISASDKARIVSALAQTQKLADQQEESARQREQQLEVMSLLGVVAGFMTHEFGVAIQELEEARSDLRTLAESHSEFERPAQRFAKHIRRLRDFVTYSSGYIQGAKTTPSQPYPVKPRIQQLKRYFGQYAEERGILIEINVEPDILAPLVPASLYNGIVLNLYTNALKAVTAKTDSGARVISFRAWNDNRWHYLEVSDTGIGIPTVLRDRIFDPLFTTTESKGDPLGSGMGLGLALVRRGAEAFGGRVEVIGPTPPFATRIRVQLPFQR